MHLVGLRRIGRESMAIEIVTIRDAIRDAEKFVQEKLFRYQILFNKQGEFRATYPAFSPEDALGVIRAFVRVTPP